MLYRYSSAIVELSEACHYVPDYVLCVVVKRAPMSHLKVGDKLVVALPLEVVGDDAEPTPIHRAMEGPKVKASRGWSRSKNGKVAEVISFGDKTPLSERQRMLSLDQRIMRHCLSDKTPTGLWERLEAERKAETEARKTALRWNRLATVPLPSGPITAADFRFGSLQGRDDVKPVRDMVA